MIAKPISSFYLKLNLKIMKAYHARLPLLLSVLFINIISVQAQLSNPRVENVYGGRINYINGYSLNATTSRIFISTESANSIFYSDVTIPASSASSFSAFNKLASADDDNGFGSGINYLQIHETSGSIFFAVQDKLYRTSVSASSATELSNGNMHTPFIYQNTMIYSKGNQLHFGTLDASGNYTASTGSPITFTSSTGSHSFAIDPITNFVYVFYQGTGSTLKLYRSSHVLSSFNSSTTFNDISPTTLSTSINYMAMNIAPDGRLFLAGSAIAAGFKEIAYSDNDTLFNTVNTGIDGVGSFTIDFSGTASDYHVYYTKAASNNKGLAGSWKVFGHAGFETHPNDGAVYADPSDTNIVYMTTDQGIGASTNEGANIFEINKGVEAVQVNDFDMTADKQTAWLASKAGIRKLSNYLTSPNWTNAIFPNGDGSPYYSAEMIADTNKVYVGNLRVYRTDNGGTTWTQKFTPESTPWSWTGAVVCEAIEVCQFDTSIVFAGYTIEGTEKGGLFYSNNSGSTWSQIKLNATTVPNKDVDVYDILFTIEGSDTVAYVGVDYDLFAPTGRSIYRVLKSGSNWIASQDMDAANTSTGSLIVASIRDLELSRTADTIFACGTDAGINHPIAYYKPLNSTNKWTPFTTSGFPFVSGKQARAITIGNDTIYVAVDNEVYNLALSASSWNLGYSYPNGTQIYVLYFDELLVGTGTGLYGHIGNSSTQGINLSSNEILIFPNPNTGIFNIKLNNTYNNIELSIYNSLGAKIYSNNYNNKSSIEIATKIDMPEGFYYLNIKTDNDEFKTKILIKK